MICGAYSFLLEDAMEVEVFVSKKKSLYLDENPLNVVQNDQIFQ